MYIGLIPIALCLTPCLSTLKLLELIIGQFDFHIFGQFLLTFPGQQLKNAQKREHVTICR